MEMDKPIHYLLKFKHICQIMRKSATTPIFTSGVNIHSEDENNSLLRILSDLRKESNMMIKILNIHQGPEVESEIQGKSSLFSVLKILQDDNDKLVKFSSEIATGVDNYDFRDVKANGYRSFLLIMQRCSVHLLTLISTVNSQNNISKWNKSLINEIISFSECFHELVKCFSFLSELKRLNDNRSLFPKKEERNMEHFQKLIDDSDSLKQDKFFGTCLGFYYCTSAQRILQVLGSIMSGCAHSFITNKSGLRGVFNTLLQTVSCFWNPANRGILMSTITRYATIEFTKQFWNLGEHPLMLEAPNMILPPVEVAVNFSLPPVSFTVPTNSRIGGVSDVTIYPPSDHNSIVSTPSIKLRLVSIKLRTGLNWIDNNQSSAYVTKSKTIKGFTTTKPYACKERSKHLLIHCHGGGFVAQSAKSHDTYLRLWAEQLQCPILSIDYSLAPEFPYPRALDECVYAVSWAIRNRRQLGCTSDAKVVLCGDSAGANLALCSTLKSIKLGIQIPDALFLAYVPVLITMTPSPARLLASIDPLLPVGILARCLLAYVGINEKDFINKVDSQNSPLSHLLSDESVQSSTNFFKQKRIEVNELKDSNFMEILQNLTNEPSPLSKVRYAKIPEDPFISPLLADDLSLSKLPPISIITSHFDPLLDDCVEFCKRLEIVGVPVTFKVMHDIPHGFLNFVLLSRECEIASQECIKMIGQLFDKSFIFNNK